MERWIESSIDRLGIVVQPSDRSRLVRQLSGFLKTLLGTFGAQAGTYAAMVLLTRFLGVESFGRFGAIQATLTAAFGLSTLGLGITATRYVAQFRIADPIRAGRVIGLCNLSAFASGLLFGASLFGSAGLISQILFHSGDLTWPIRITAFAILLMSMNANQSGTLIGFQAFGRLLRVQILQSFLTVGLTYALVSAYGFDGAVATLPLTSLIGYVLLHREISRELKSQGIVVRYREAWPERQILTEFAFPAAVSGIVGSGAVWIAQALLVRSEAGLAGMGLWTAAASMRAAVMLGPGVLARVSSPMLSTLHDYGRAEEYEKTMWSTALAASAGALAAGLLIALCSPWIVFLFGKDYMSAVGLIPLVVGSAVVEAYASSVSQALVAHRRLDYQLAVIGIWGLTLITCTWWGTSRYAATGLAFAYLMAWMTSAIAYTWIARKLITDHKTGPRSAADTIQAAQT